MATDVVITCYRNLEYVVVYEAIMNPETNIRIFSNNFEKTKLFMKNIKKLSQHSKIKDKIYLLTSTDNEINIKFRNGSKITAYSHIEQIGFFIYDVSIVVLDGIVMDQNLLAEWLGIISPMTRKLIYGLAEIPLNPSNL